MNQSDLFAQFGISKRIERAYLQCAQFSLKFIEKEKDNRTASRHRIVTSTCVMKTTRGADCLFAAPDSKARLPFFTFLARAGSGACYAP
jgi:hypothetical protein